MMLSFLRKPVLLLISALMLAATANSASAQSEPIISVLTFQPGTVYWQRFGHNAILVRSDGKQTVYNYGIFDFNQKNFMLNFAAGRMQYRLAAEPLTQALYPYHVEGRWTLEQQLALTPSEANKLAEFLVTNAKPENAEYRYDYFIANCSTKVRDALDQALSGLLQQQLKAQPASLNYREQIARVSAPEPALMLGMDITLGPGGDQNINLWQESFIPGVLMRALRHVEREDGTPLVVAERLILKGSLPEAPTEPPQLWPLFMAIGFASGLLILGLGMARSYLAARISLGIIATTFTLLCSVGGLVFALAWGLTEHWAMYANQNLLLLNPVYLLLLPLWLTAMRKKWRPSVFAHWLLRLIIVGVVVSALLHFVPGLEQGNLHWVALLVPIHLALFWIAERAFLHSERT